MRKFLVISCMLLFTVPLIAQERGNLLGQVVDVDGSALPGVTVTLTGATTAPLTFITSNLGKFRFIALYPARDYVIKAELSGFKTRIEEGVSVSLGEDSLVTITLEMGTLEEEVTVTAVKPVIDTRKTSISQSMDYNMLQSLPTSRDVWVIMQMAAGTQIDRENIGGSESGMMSGLVARGGSSSDTVWVLDGMVVTDHGATGNAPIYWDFDNFEEITVTTGSDDVSNQTGGIKVNLLTRRGGNNLKFAGRFYFTDEKLQANVSDAKLETLGLDGYNYIKEIKDYGFNIGGPIFKDKVWLWGSWGVQDIQNIAVTGAKDNTYLRSMVAKINIQVIPQNRFEAFIHATKKAKLGRGASPSQPLGNSETSPYHFGAPVLKIQDEHMFGDNLFLSVKYGWNKGGRNLHGMDDIELKELTFYNYAQDLWENSYRFHDEVRPKKSGLLQGSYYSENIFGASHEIKFGAEYISRGIHEKVSRPGNMMVYYNYNTRTVDWDGDGVRDYVLADFGVDLMNLQVFRTDVYSAWNKAWVAYINDTMTFGRFSLKAGVRLDVQRPVFLANYYPSVFVEDTDEYPFNNFYEIWQKYTTDEVAAKMNGLLPGLDAPGAEPDFRWKTWGPRLGLTWDVSGDGKTVAKLSASMYHGFMGVVAGAWAPRGRGGEINFWWDDANANSVVDLSELYWAANDGTRTVYRAWNDAGVFQGNWLREEGMMWEGYNYEDPQETTPSTYTVDDNWGPTRTREVLLSVERQIFPDFGAAIDLQYRKIDNFSRTQYLYPEQGDRTIDNTDYEIAGVIPAELAPGVSSGEAAGRNWYVQDVDVTYSRYRYRTNYGSDRYNTYYGLSLRLNKRLANRWMLNGSFTLQKQAAQFGTDGYNNPTNLWATEGFPYASRSGSLDVKVGVYMYSKWLLKLQGLYQIPWQDITVSFTTTGREGYIIPAYFNIEDETLPNPRSQSAQVYTETFGTTRLPNLWNLNIRIEKMITAGQGRIHLTADIFNVFNINTMMRRLDKNLGTYYADTDEFVPYSRYFQPNEILNPTVIRFGLRFEF